jgi:hypothetical protein
MIHVMIQILPKKNNLRHKRNLVNPLNAELNPIRHLLALAGARHFVHVSRLRVNDCGGGGWREDHGH